MSEEEINAWTVFEAKAGEGSYEEAEGLLDPRLGSCSRFDRCETCKETEECPGHFCRITLD